MNILIMRWIMLLPFSVKTTIKISILMIMLPHEAWVSAGLSETSKNTQVLHQCSLLWESELTMPRCYLKQQPIPSMRFLRLSDMITSFISAGFFTSWKDIRQENTESWETNSEIHNIINPVFPPKEDATESSNQRFLGILFSLFAILILQTQPNNNTYTHYLYLCVLL